MKQIKYNLINMQILGNIVTKLRVLLSSGEDVEVVIQNRKDSATLAQFKAIFGAWFTYLQDTTGRSKNYWHNGFKVKFLVDIYASEPYGNMQEIWADNIIMKTNSGDTEGAHNTARMISLSWASKEQFCQYMNDIEVYFIGKGEPLPIIEKKEYRKTYESMKRRIGK